MMLICYNVFFFGVDEAAKKRRGVVVGQRTKNICAASGWKILVEYDEFHKAPKCETVASLMARDIGMKMKDDVPMLAPTYGDLSVNDKLIVINYLTVCFHLSLMNLLFSPCCLGLVLLANVCIFAS